LYLDRAGTLQLSQKQYNEGIMKIKFSLGTETGSLTIQREEGDPKARASGYTRGIHGWGAEIHLLGMLLKKLNKLGFGLVRKRLAGDSHFSHMYGDDHMCYLRTGIHRNRDFPHLWIVDGQYAVLSSSDEYNKGEKVVFDVRGDIFQERDQPPKQPDWFNRVKAICDEHGIDCELYKWCLPAPYKVVDVLVNYHAESNNWLVSAHGTKDRDSTDNPDQLGGTDEAENKEDAIQLAELIVWRLLNDNKARQGVIFVNGDEESVYELDDNNRVVKVAEKEPA